ncbi:hypothetical protein ACKFKF_04905 [Phormidesmis sp. 146-12]
MRRLLMTVVASTAILVGLVSVTVAQSPKDALVDSIDKASWEVLPVIDHESDPAVEKRNLNNEFRGTNLTPRQFEQVRKANTKLIFECYRSWRAT